MPRLATRDCSSIFFSGLLGFLILRSVFNTLVSYTIQDFNLLRPKDREGPLIILGLGLLVPGYITDLLGVLFMLILVTGFLAPLTRLMTYFRFSSFPKKGGSNFDSDFLQGKSKDTIIEGEYVNLSDIPEKSKEKD